MDTDFAVTRPGGTATRPPRRPGRPERAGGAEPWCTGWSTRNRRAAITALTGQARPSSRRSPMAVSSASAELNIDPYLHGGRVESASVWASVRGRRVPPPRDRGRAGHRGDPGGPQNVRSAPIADRERVGRPVLRVPGVPVLRRRTGLHLRASATGRLTPLPSGAPDRDPARRQRHGTEDPEGRRCRWLARHSRSPYGCWASCCRTTRGPITCADRLRSIGQRNRDRFEGTGGSGPIGFRRAGARLPAGRRGLAVSLRDDRQPPEWRAGAWRPG